MDKVPSTAKRTLAYGCGDIHIMARTGDASMVSSVIGHFRTSNPDGEGPWLLVAGRIGDLADRMQCRQH